VSYTTSDKIKQLAGIASESDDSNRTALITSTLLRVDAMIDETLGTWFDNRARIFYIAAPHSRCERIFIRAPIITVTEIVERGTVLDLTTDVILEKHIGAIKKTPGSFWETGMYDDDTQIRYPIKVTGTFGFSSVPADIDQAASELGAILAGLKKRTFITNEGIERTVNVTSMPEYITQLLAHRRWHIAQWQDVEEVVPSP
jgi:hypothetical protein